MGLIWELGGHIMVIAENNTREWMLFCYKALVFACI